MAMKANNQKISPERPQSRSLAVMASHVGTADTFHKRKIVKLIQKTLASLETLKTTQIDVTFGESHAFILHLYVITPGTHHSAKASVVECALKNASLDPL